MEESKLNMIAKTISYEIRILLELCEREVLTLKDWVLLLAVAEWDWERVRKREKDKGKINTQEEKEKDKQKKKNFEQK